MLLVRICQRFLALANCPHSIFRQILTIGGTVTLANLHSPASFEAISRRRIRYAAGTFVNLSRIVVKQRVIAQLL